MAQVSTYLNFRCETEAAFNFYKTVFGTEFNQPIMRFSDMPPQEGMSELSEADKNLVVHVELPIVGGHILRGTDAPESMGFNLVMGQNVHINLEVDTRAEADRFMAALSNGGVVSMPMADMFWGDYFGSCTDKFGVQWMFNCSQKA